VNLRLTNLMMDRQTENPLIIQSDRTILMDMHAPRAAEARERMAPFTELVKSPEHVHTYRLTPLSIWNACAVGMSGEKMIAVLRDFAKYPPPEIIFSDIHDLAERYGSVILKRQGDHLKLLLRDLATAELLANDKQVSTYLGKRLGPLHFKIASAHRGVLKQALVEAGYPADDQAGFIEGEPISIRLREQTRSGVPFKLRGYQQQAVNAFYHSGSLEKGGSGVICLPCGAGKTMVGLGGIAKLGQTALILTTSRTSVTQWRREILDKTDLSEDMIAEYTGQSKDIGPITLTTYQMLTWRANKAMDFPHFKLFHARSWGLIIYDEVHLLPAPIFRITAELQARRRLGMTATLIREDGHEGDVFALIGPKRYDLPWRELAQKGWIANAVCTEIRVPMPTDLRMTYALASRRKQFRIAAENPQKDKIVEDILARHPRAGVLIIGEYLQQLRALAHTLSYPLVTGKTPQNRREQLYNQFRNGNLFALILSRVGNFALDLPDADVLIQVSGIYGSRQEEAQRLGRILRPKADGRQARFFTLVSQHTREEEYARNRQRFLTEQGYAYHLEFTN
jgi:DNA excision repair protein ERCC-3